MKMKTNTFKLSIFLTLLMAFFATQNSWAAANNWTAGSGNANWADAGNWSDGIPTSDDDVTITTQAFELASIPNGVTVNSFTMTSGGNITTVGTFDVTGALVITANKLTTGGILTVGGNISGAGELDVTGQTLTAGGDITVTTLTTTNGTTLNLSGTVASLPALTIGDLTLSGSASITLGGALDIDDAGTGNGVLTISAGTLITNTQTLTVDGTTSIVGSLTGSTGTKTFTGDVTNTGSLNMTGAATIALGGSYSGAGTIATVATTNITVDGTSTPETVALPSSITTMGTLNIAATSPAVRIVTIADDLTIATLTFGANAAGSHTFTLGANTVIITNAFTGVANSTINASGSTVTFSGTTNFTAGTLTTTGGATGTSFDFGAAVTAFPATATALNNLTTAGNITLLADLTLAGNLTISAGALTVGANTLTVGGSATLAAASLTTDGTSKLVFTGSTEVTLPAATNTIGKLTINKPSGNVKLQAGTTTLGGVLGANGGLTISGAASLDLNGAHNVRLAQATTVISETGTGTVVNTGVAGAYIETSPGGSTDAEINASGIGVSITGGSGLAVFRYPQFLTNLETGKTSVGRVYAVSTLTNLTAITFNYKLDELFINQDLTLRLYECTNAAGAGATLKTATNSPSGTVSYTATWTGTKFFAFQGDQLSYTGYKYFNGSASNSWENANNWTPTGIPTTADSVLIPTGMSVVTGGAINAKSITLVGSASLVVGHAATIASAANGGIILKDRSQFIINAAVAVAIGSATYRGDIDMRDNSSFITTAAGSVTLSGTWTKAVGASISHVSPITYTFVGTTNLTLPSTVNSVVAVEVNKTGGASVTMTGDLTTVTTLTVTAGTLYTNGNDLTVTTTTSIVASATLDASGSGTNTFTTGITNNGTLKANGATNTFSAAFPAGGAGTYDLKNSTSGFTLGVGGAGTSTINAEGATITFTSTVAFGTVTLNTDSKTNLVFTIAPGSNTPAAGLTTNNLTIGGNITFGGNVTVYGNLTISAGSTTVNGKTVTVYGTYNPTGGTVVATAASSKLVLYGPITSWGTFTTDVNTDLEIRGTGTITPVSLTGVTAIGDVVMDRSGANLAAAGALAINSLAINKGTVTCAAAVTSVTTTTSIAKEGTLVANAATSVTFTQTLSGTGTIDADGNDNLIFTVAPTFTGNLMTGNSTILTYTAGGPLPASVTNLEHIILTTGTVTFNSNVTIVTAVGAAHLVANGSVFNVNGYTLTLTNGIVAGAIGGITLTNGSTLISSVAADFTGIAARLLTDETSNLVLYNTTTLTVANAVAKLNNVTLITAGALTLPAVNLAIYGNLTIGTGCTVTNSANTLTVYGNIINSGTPGLVLTNAGLTTLYGQITGAGTYTTSNATLLKIAGGGQQFSLPAGVTTLGTLTLNRVSGMKLNAALTLGNAAGTDLTLTSGDLDLNGYNITFAATGDIMTETVGSTVVNTGATGAYITTFPNAGAGIVIANVNASGIGVTNLNTSTNAIVRRYPQSVAISGQGNSISRIYYVYLDDANSSAIDFAYDDSQLNGNRPAALAVYRHTAIDFAAPTAITTTNSLRKSVTATAVTFGTAYYYTMVSTTYSAGTTKTWDGSAGNGLWSTAANWTPEAVPVMGDEVIIPTGYTVNLNANSEATNVTINGNSVLNTNAYALHLAGSLTVNSSATGAFTAGAGSSIIIEGGLNNTSTGTVDLATADCYLYVGGTITNTSTGSFSVDGGTYFTVNGATNAVLPSNFATLHTLVVNKTAGSTLTTSADLTISGPATLDVLSGELIIPSDFTLTVTGATNVANGATLTATGTATRTFNGTVTVDGAGVINLSGAGSRTFADDISISPTTAGATLNLENATVTVTDAASLAFGTTSTLNLKGTTIDFSSQQPLNFANGTTQFSENTNLTFSDFGVISNFPTVSQLQSLTLSGATTLTLASNLATTGNVTLSAGNLNIGAYTLTANGTFNGTSGTITHTTNSKLVLNGAVTAYPTLVPTVAGSLSITVGGTGALATLPVAYTNLYDIVMNRVGQDLVFGAGAVVNSMTVTSGEVTVLPTADFTVTTTTNVESAGTLDISATGADRLRTFTTGLAGAGTINGTGASAAALCRINLATTCSYSFTGTLTTNAYTDLIINATQANDVSIPSSVTALNRLYVSRTGTNTVTLNANLTLSGVTTEAQFDSGTLIVGANTLTFSNTYDTDLTGFVLNGLTSTLVFNSLADFNTATPTTQFYADETTSITFGGGANDIIGFPAVSNLNNLTINTSGVRQLDLRGSLTLAGNLTLNGNGTATNAIFNVPFVAANNLVVNGTVSNQGQLIINGTGTITLNGLMSGNGLYDTDNSTVIKVAGTSSRMQLPAGISVLGRLELDRDNGLQLNANLDLGDATTTNYDLYLLNGNVDLNGYVIAFTNALDKMSEAAEATVINTGATNALKGYVQTASTSGDNLILSGIGVLNFGTNNASNFIVRRYPKSIPITGVGISTARYYQILGTAPTPSSSSKFQLQYDNTELTSVASALKLYTSATDAFTITTAQTTSNGSNRTVNANTPTGKGNVAHTTFNGGNPAAGYYYVLAAAPSSGGVMKTYAGATNGKWSVDANWSPSGVPAKIDDVVIGESVVILDGSGVTYECNSLFLNHATSELKPNDNTVDGDLVSLRVMGDVTLNVPGAAIEGTNGKGRLNLLIGDGTTAGVTSTITSSNHYNTGAGLWMHDFTINAASVSFAGNYEVRLTGDLSMLSNSALDASGASIVMYGGYKSGGTQTISVPSSANLLFNVLKLENNAKVATASSFQVNDSLVVKKGSELIASNGTVMFNITGNPGWWVEDGATLRLWHVDMYGTAGILAPYGNIEIQGNLTKTGDADFAPTNGYVTFRNNGLREIVNTPSTAPENLKFWNLRVYTGSQVATSSNFQIQREIDVMASAEMKADNGTIYFVGGIPQYIKNVSTQTLEFNNLTISSGTVYTSNSWTVKGNLTVTSSLIADNGTITFTNTQEKVISNAGTTEFFKILVSDGSKVKTENGNNSFTVVNNATYPSNSGIEVQGNGQFNMNSTSVITFDSKAGVASGYPKTITKSSTGTMKFGAIALTGAANNEVTTASDFTMLGTIAGTFNNSGAGGYFNATGGTITFTGVTPTYINVSPAVTNFYGLATSGTTVLTLRDGDDLHIRGNVTVDGTSKLLAGGTSQKVYFDGTTQQIIGGNSTALNPIQFADVEVNKGTNSFTTNDEVLLTADVVINSDVAHELTLTNGILNLGSKTLTVGAGIISRMNGVINGGTGNYVVATHHENPLLEDNYFTINGTPTLYNLRIDAAHQTANHLTVNGELNLNLADLTIGSGANVNAPIKLTVLGDLTRTNGEITGSTTLSRLVLSGTGTVDNGLSNNYFTGTTATTVQLEVARQETLGGNLNIANGSSLRVNTGINTFDIGTNILTFDNNTFNMVMLSGGIDADAGTVVLPSIETVIPASMFANNIVKNLTLADATTIAGDVTITGALSGVQQITTNDNVLIFGPDATIPAYTSTYHIVGNLQRTVKSTATLFPIGGGSNNYRPITLNFANSGSEQVVLISSNNVDPTIGRGGNPKNAVNIVWTITPQGTNIADSLKAKFEWTSGAEATTNGGQIAIANASFPAKWDGTKWVDYRSKLNNFAVVDPRALTMSGNAISSVSDLNGVWAIFNAATNADADKDRAIELASQKLVITSMKPSTFKVNEAVKITVQLQNNLGQAITTASDFDVQLKLHQGATFATATATIPAGSSSVTFSGQIFTSAGANTQLLADTVGGSIYWQPGLSNIFNVYEATPPVQSTGVTFTNVNETSMSIAWTKGGTNDLVVLKADTLLAANEFPVNGTTYVANTICGAGSNLGNAVVIYNGTGNSVNVTGLAPNTKYYVYVFAYAGSNGTESYKTTAASGNPNATTTTGSYDDDATLGTNNTRETSKTIGTNTPVSGTIKTADDVDWFNFTVTSTAPNIRGTLVLTSDMGNYDMELYNMAGRRIRRGIRVSNNNEAQVINDLPAGTYTVKVMGIGGIFSTTSHYKLKVTTSNDEIFSVTP